MSHLPFLGHRDPSAVLSWRGGQPVRVRDFLRDVGAVAECLPARAYLVNLCVDRYRFAVGLAAAMLRGQVSLLPPGHTPELLRALADTYSDMYALVEKPGDYPVAEVVVLAAARGAPPPRDVPAFASSQLAAIAFTSGSTGRPAPHPKTWGQLARVAQGEAQRFGLLAGSPSTLIATVPPQHMYGLETSVLMGLHTGLALHPGRPFYPADVRATLEQIDGARVLVTTPVHLRALVSVAMPLPPLRLIVSATAPLSPDLAQSAEARFGAPVHEVFGFTEAGAVATRRTLAGAQWCTLPDVTLREDERGIWFTGGHLDHAVRAADVITPLGPTFFTLEGRGADVVNIAGKRSSLAYLNHQLATIEGVEDGVFFMPDESDNAVTRLVAFVVAPRLGRDAFLSELRRRVDAAFLPRPLYFVAALPRNATGKLPRETLTQLAATCGVWGGGQDDVAGSGGSPAPGL